MGHHDINKAHPILQQIENRLQGIKSALEQSLALVLPDVVGVAGRFGIVTKPGSPLSGGVVVQPFTVPHIRRLHGVHMSDGHAAELLEIWRSLHQLNLLQGHKGVALALRRLGYQAQRERPEDELLDVMIAAEALYLTGVGNEEYRGELRYRLALRAALWADPKHAGYTKREVLGIMKAAYDARSAIAHGGTPEPKVVKVRGEKVSLGELLKAARWVIVRGARAAVARLAAGGSWPPDWDGLALGELVADAAKAENDYRL